MAVVEWRDLVIGRWKRSGFFRRKRNGVGRLSLGEESVSGVGLFKKEKLELTNKRMF